MRALRVLRSLIYVRDDRVLCDDRALCDDRVLYHADAMLLPCQRYLPVILALPFCHPTATFGIPAERSDEGSTCRLTPLSRKKY